MAEGGGSWVETGSEQGSNNSLEMTGFRRRERDGEGWRI